MTRPSLEDLLTMFKLLDQEITRLTRAMGDHTDGLTADEVLDIVSSAAQMRKWRWIDLEGVSRSHRLHYSVGALPDGGLFVLSSTDYRQILPFTTAYLAHTQSGAFEFDLRRERDLIPAQKTFRVHEKTQEGPHFLRIYTQLLSSVRKAIVQDAGSTRSPKDQYQEHYH